MNGHSLANERETANNTIGPQATRPQTQSWCECFSHFYNMWRVMNEGEAAEEAC